MAKGGAAFPRTCRRIRSSPGRTAQTSLLVVASTSLLRLGVIVQVCLEASLVSTSASQAWAHSYHLGESVPTILIAFAHVALVDIPVSKHLALFHSGADFISSNSFERRVSIIVLINSPDQETAKTKLICVVNLLLERLLRVEGDP